MKTTYKVSDFTKRKNLTKQQKAAAQRIVNSLNKALKQLKKDFAK